MRNVLITGGTGSLGQALARALLARGAERLCILSRDEAKQEDMLRALGHDPRLRMFLGDVRDRDRLELAMRGVDTVIHAAALKRVPALQYSPSEGVMTNVIGSLNVIGAALAREVPRVLAISTDKACEPVNLYGCTKATMEHTFVAANAYSWPGGPAFSCVRYGNVAGSRGSVVPLWRELIERGEPLPVTDARMTRFWIRMDEAVALVLRALERMCGGEIYIPKIPAFDVTDLATAMGPCAWTQTGIRPGEKLHESLIGRAESLNAYDLGDDFVLLPHGRSVGIRVADDFTYHSGTWDWRLGVDALRAELQYMESERRAA